MRAQTKSHKSTVCIIPPLAVQQAVQRIRCFRDKSFVRWPPHINLLYPFLEVPSFDEAATAATHALAQLPPFKVRAAVSSHDHSSCSTHAPTKPLFVFGSPCCVQHSTNQLQCAASSCLCNASRQMCSKEDTPQLALP